MAVVECGLREAIKLAPFSSKIEFAGSIRRQKASPNDVDLVIIPKSKGDKARIINYAKQHSQGNIGRGDSHASYRIDGVEIEIYFATKENFGAVLLYATGSQRYNVWLRKLAKFKGFKLNQYGLWKRQTNEKVAGETEEGIYEALGKKWRPPYQRGEFERR